MYIKKKPGAEVVYTGLTDIPLNEVGIQPAEAADHRMHLGLAGIDFGAYGLLRTKAVWELSLNPDQQD